MPDAKQQKLVVDDRVFWLASYPKSGNTWVRAAFSAYFSNDSSINNMLCSASDADPYLYQLASGNPLNAIEEFEWSFYTGTALMYLTRMYATRPLLVKTHHAKLSPWGIPLIPNNFAGKGIYAVRDPRDVVVSFAEHLGIEMDEAIKMMGAHHAVLGGKAVERPVQFLGNWSVHVMSWVGCTDFPVAVLRYEDMLEDQSVALTNLLKFLGIEVLPQKVKRAVKAASFKQLKKEENDGGFREASPHTKFFKRGKAGGWRDVLTGSQARQIESDHHIVMKRFGYEPAFFVPEIDAAFTPPDHRIKTQTQGIVLPS